MKAKINFNQSIKKLCNKQRLSNNIVVAESVIDINVPFQIGYLMKTETSALDKDIQCKIRLCKFSHVF